VKKFDTVFQVADVLWYLYVAFTTSLLLLGAIILVRAVTLGSAQGADFLTLYLKKIVGEFE